MSSLGGLALHYELEGHSVCNIHLVGGGLKLCSTSRRPAVGGRGLRVDRSLLLPSVRVLLGKEADRRAGF